MSLLRQGQGAVQVTERAVHGGRTGPDRRGRQHSRLPVREDRPEDRAERVRGRRAPRRLRQHAQRARRGPPRQAARSGGRRRWRQRAGGDL